MRSRFAPKNRPDPRLTREEETVLNKLDMNHLFRSHYESINQTHTCLWTRVGRWRNNMRADPTVPCSTGVSGLADSMATLAFGVVTLSYSARAALFALVGVLVDKGTSVCHSASINKNLVSASITVGFLCSPRYLPESPPS